MATILKRGVRWRVQIRRQGQRILSKSFASKAKASAWARETESTIDRGQSIEAGRRVTLSDLIEAYREQVTAAKGMSRSKAQAVEKIEKLLGLRRLVELKTGAFIEFCKKRETEGAGPATILQDFFLHWHRTAPRRCIDGSRASGCHSNHGA